jgi:uncharacterized membrane protein YciS (DUF1049 family)
MVRIIVSVVLLVLLAVLVSLNIGYTTSVNLFGAHVFSAVSIVAVAALSFAFGIVYSCFIYIGTYLRRKAKRELATKGQSMKVREKQLDSREADSEHAAKAAAALDSRAQDTASLN